VEHDRVGLRLAGDGDDDGGLIDRVGSSITIRRWSMIPRIIGASASIWFVTGTQVAAVRTGRLWRLKAIVDSGLRPLAPVVAVASATIAAAFVNVSSRI
jgi:hypothetical protein